jgi:N-acetylmuramoyl-L-alanine amidase
MMLQANHSNSCIRSVPAALAVAGALICVFVLCAPTFAQSIAGNDVAAARILLPEAARHFGAATSWKPDERKLTLSYRGTSAEILIGGDRLVVDDYLMPLSSPVKASGGAVTMALTDATALFTRLLGRQVAAQEISSAGLLYQPEAVAAESHLIKSVRYVTYPRFTRIIINISGDENAESIDVKLREAPNALTVELPQSRLIQPPEAINIGGRIVSVIDQVRAGSDVKLIVKTVPEDIKYEIQKHNDPPRIVVDVSPAAPEIATDFLVSPDLPTRPNGWAEPEPVAPKEKFPFTTIVIDPGHGGKDRGAQGRGGLYEKDVTFGIALKLKKLVEEKTGIEVVLTRTGDYFVPLKDRTAIANHAKDGMPADLFISIHTNAHKSPKVGGFESFYISDSIDPDAEATAALENAVIELEMDPTDPLPAPLTPILWDLQFTEFVAESSEFAAFAQKELAERLNTRNRGVRQGQFIVLAGVAMPAVLVEVGFISNRVEEAKLKTSDFRNKCAAALSVAISEFKKRRDVRLGQLKEEPEK